MSDRPACKQPVLLAIDDTGVSHVLAKGPEVELSDCVKMIRDLTDADGVYQCGKETMQVVSAAIIGKGRYHKHRSFASTADKKAAAAAMEAIKKAEAEAAKKAAMKAIKKAEAEAAKE